MTTNSTRTACPARVVAGSSSNFWIWSSEGWDLTHPPTPESAPVVNCVHLNCEVSNVIIDPVKTALVVIDMQNMALNPALEPPASPAMYKAQDALVQHAIPAARELRLQIVWLNWGLTDEEIAEIPPAEVRLFAFNVDTEKEDYGLSDRGGHPSDPDNFLRCGERPCLTRLPGTELGEIVLKDGTRINAGRAMMRGTWNTALHGPLAVLHEEGKRAFRPDVWIHKNRNSGLWNENSACSEFFKKEGIRTLLFTGVNIDQCVGATLQDAHAQGFDTILLKDGCATDSPGYAQASYEFNCVRAWGFLSSCRALAKAAGLDWKHDDH